ncbi:hypothetical protein GGR56DRAFT_426559 [Xylariaceae sp. FL0804]|nr:hypothetical protein GGR56DRAFT_426559 [Xylariaceae sp. FL0804]
MASTPEYYLFFEATQISPSNWQSTDFLSNLSLPEFIPDNILYVAFQLRYAHLGIIIMSSQSNMSFNATDNAARYHFPSRFPALARRVAFRSSSGYQAPQGPYVLGPRPSTPGAWTPPVVYMRRPSSQGQHGFVSSPRYPPYQSEAAAARGYLPFSNARDDEEPREPIVPLRHQYPSPSQEDEDPRPNDFSQHGSGAPRPFSVPSAVNGGLASGNSFGIAPLSRPASTSLHNFIDPALVRRTPTFPAEQSGLQATEQKNPKARDGYGEPVTKSLSSAEAQRRGRKGTKRTTGVSSSTNKRTRQMASTSTSLDDKSGNLWSKILGQPPKDTDESTRQPTAKKTKLVGSYRDLLRGPEDEAKKQILPKRSISEILPSQRAVLEPVDRNRHDQSQSSSQSSTAQVGICTVDSADKKAPVTQYPGPDPRSLSITPTPNSDFINAEEDQRRTASTQEPVAQRQTRLGGGGGAAIDAHKQHPLYVDAAVQGESAPPNQPPVPVPMAAVCVSAATQTHTFPSDLHGPSLQEQQQQQPRSPASASSTTLAAVVADAAAALQEATETPPAAATAAAEGGAAAEAEAKAGAGAKAEAGGYESDEFGAALAAVHGVDRLVRERLRRPGDAAAVRALAVDVLIAFVLGRDGDGDGEGEGKGKEAEEGEEEAAGLAAQLEMALEEEVVVEVDVVVEPV